VPVLNSPKGPFVSALWFLFFSSTGIWSQGLMFAKELYHLSNSTSSVLCWVFLRKVLRTICPGQALNFSPCDLCLLSS
jgi:hypothetical protein